MNQIVENSQIVEKTLIHNPPKRVKMLTRSQTARDQINNLDEMSKKQTNDDILPANDRNDPPDKENSE